MAGFCLLMGEVVWEGIHAGQVAIHSGSGYLERAAYPNFGGDGPMYGSCIDNGDVFYADVDWQTGTFKVDLPQSICGLGGGEGTGSDGMYYMTAGVVDPLTPTVAACAYSCEHPANDVTIRTDNCVIIEDIQDLPSPYGAVYWYSFFKIISDGSLTFKKRFCSESRTDTLSSLQYRGFEDGLMWFVGALPDYNYRLECWDCSGDSPVRTVNTVIHVPYMVFLAIDYAARKVEIAGISEIPYGDWMKQIARNLTDPFEGFLKKKKYLIHDRDPLFTEAFKHTLKAGGVKAIKSMPLAPNFNPFAERFIRSIKAECLDQMIIFGEKHLRHCIQEYIDHYHTERAHQGLDNNLIDPPPQGTGQIVCQERLGGLLKFYRRAA